MGYFAIKVEGRFPKENIVFCKTNETIFPSSMFWDYTIFEIELEIKPIPGSCEHQELELHIIIPGEIKHLDNCNRLLTNQEFAEWYYSSMKYDMEQQTISDGNKVIHLRECEVTDNSNNGNLCEGKNIFTTIKMKVKLNLPETTQDDQPPVKVTSIFAFSNKGHTVKHFGNIRSESRYFDKKIFEEDSAQFDRWKDKFIKPNQIYCWFVIPRLYVASDYTNTGIYRVRDMRIIESRYTTLLSKRSRLFRLRSRWADRIIGRPQMLRWLVVPDTGKSNSLKEFRLHVTCSSYFFIYLAGMASIAGLILSIIALIVSLLQCK